MDCEIDRNFSKNWAIRLLATGEECGVDAVVQSCQAALVADGEGEEVEVGELLGCGESLEIAEAQGVWPKLKSWAGADLA